MNCLDQLRKAYILSWVGDRQFVERTWRECRKELSEEGLRERVGKVLERADREWEIPSLLREEGIEGESLVREALGELLERLYRTTEEREVRRNEYVIYSVSDLGLKKVVRGYCERCYGYRSVNLEGGFGVRYEQMVYLETTGDADEALSTLLKDIFD
ncbi:MAG: hypothetical protein RXS23_10195 [Metallosphaera yellowstonensis]